MEILIAETVEPTRIYLILYAPENFKESLDQISDFASSLVEISRGCIPQTSAGPSGGGHGAMTAVGAMTGS